MKLSKTERKELAGALQTATGRGLQGKPILGQYQYFEQFGIVDNNKPSEPRQRKDFRGIFYKCLAMRADSVSDALSKSFVERMVGQEEFAPVEFRHPWYSLLKNPSKLWTADDVWEWASLSVDLTGRADFIVERDSRNMPVQLLPVYPEFGHIEIVPSAEGGVMRWLLYRSDGQIIPIARENVVRLDRKSPYSPYETYSLIEAARFDLDTTAEMKTYRAGSVKDGGFTSPLITTDQDLSEEQHKQLSQEYKKFVGTRGLSGGKVGVLGSGAKPYTPQTARDLEFINGEAQTDKSIMIICGVPPGMFESTTTRATAEGAQVVFAQQTIAKIVGKFASQLTHQFEIIFNAEPNALYVRPPDVVPLDKDFELRQRQSYLSTGQRVINDYLLQDGFQPDPNGNERYIPLSWMPISRRAEEQAEPIRTAPKKAQRTEEQRAILWRNIDQKKRRQAQLMRPTLNNWFDDIKRQILSDIEENYERKFTQDVFDPLTAEYDLLERLAPEVIRAIRAGFINGSQLAGITGLEFTVNNPQVTNALKTILSRQQSIPQTLFDNVAKVIQDGMNERVSRSEMASRVSQFFDGYQPGKVENISNGLSTATWETGQDIAYTEAGVTQKEWLSSRDNDVRPSHAQADGTRVDISQTFTVGNAQLRFPADPDSQELSEVIGCRCVTLPVLD